MLIVGLLLPLDGERALLSEKTTGIFAGEEYSLPFWVGINDDRDVVCAASLS